MNPLWIAAAAFNIAKTQHKINDINKNLRNVLQNNGTKKSRVFNEYGVKKLGQEEFDRFVMDLNKILKILERVELGHYSGTYNTYNILQGLSSKVDRNEEIIQRLQNNASIEPPISSAIICDILDNCESIKYVYTQMLNFARSRKNNTTGAWIVGGLLIIGAVIMAVVLPVVV